MNIRKSLLITALLSFFMISNVAYAGNYYWVGNSGNWSDASHWSNSSGGIGGAGVPTQNDNIFIDENSFSIQNALISIGANISINNFNIPLNRHPFTIESSANNTINIYGSFDVRAIFDNKIKSEIHFKSNSSSIKQLYFGWWNWSSDFYFEGKGKYVFISPLQLYDNDLYLNSGEIDLNGYDVLCGRFISISGNKRKIRSNNSTILAYHQWTTNPTKFAYDFSQSRIIVVNSAVTAVNKGGDNFPVTQSQNNPAAKTVFSVTIDDDTVSCGNNCDATLFISNVNTDCPPYSVNWLPGNPAGDGTDTIFNLCPGSYQAVVTDNCGGILPQPATVSGHLNIVPIAETITTATCKGICDGGVSILVTGAPYAVMTYFWAPPGGTGQATNTYTDLCAGAYSVQVQDGFGCDTTFFYTVPEPDSVRANLNVTDVLCFGDCSGAITANPTGGSPGYSYLWSANVAPNSLTNPSVSNLCIGTYSVTVTDTNGCTGDTTVTITSPNQISLDTVISHVSCGGLCDASIVVTVLGGGVAPFTHNWSTGQVDVGNVSTVVNLCIGTYTDSIVDANGCDTVLTFTITQPNVLTTSTNTTNVTCNGFCDGTATTVPAGGTPPFNSIVWDMIPTQVPFPVNGNPIGSLCVGNYYVTVTDANNCIVQDTFSITEPQPLLANPSSTNVTCPGFCDGTATVAPTGGTTPYSYGWTGPGGPYNTQSINSLCPGTYIVTVTDSNNCTYVDSVVITEPQPLVLTMSSTDESCSGVCDGTAVVAITGGTAPYTYVWVPDPGVPNGQGTDSIFNLCPGNYTVNITDASGCSANNTVTINPQAPVTINLVTTDLSCNGVCNGTATVFPAGGVAPYDISWNGGPYVTGNTTLSGLCAGNYTVDVRDANGCITSQAFSITEPPLLTVTSSGTDLSCFGVCDGTITITPNGGTAPYIITTNGPGGPYNGSPLSNLCAGTYIITITDDSLCSVQDTVIINEPAPLDPNTQFTPVSCNGLNDGSAISIPIGGTPSYSFNWTGPGGPYNSQAIGPLASGQYIVTVTDTNGCIGIDTVNLINPPVLTVSAAATNASCGTVCDGTALATPNGGTPGYTYSWNTTPVQTTQSATGLCAGIYTVTVTDTNGCTAQDTTTINNIITIQINPSVIGISCNGICDGTATAVPSGGLNPYTYLWSNGDTSQTADSLCPGWVYVTVTDANGCASTDSINMPFAPPVLFPNGSIDQAISCNGACDAMVSSAPSGGTPPYSLVWTLPNGIDTNNVCSPYAVITVTDANNCVQSDTLYIAEPDSIAPNPTITNLSCNGDNSGSICLAPTGGTPGTTGYTYAWLPGGQNTACINGQPAGVYTVTITDSTGCSRVEIYTITEPPAFISSPIQSDISCFGLCDGMATVTIGGGTTPYTYNWSPNGETTDSIINLCQGNYSVIVSDSNGCTTSQNFTINEPTQLDANVTGTDLACGGGPCNGTAISNPNGGTAPYTYQWSANAAPNVLTNQGINNLCADTFNVTVTDTNGCTANGTYIVTVPTQLSVTLDSTNITCNGSNDGTATATPTGGVPPYTYSWVGTCNPVPSNTPTITGLCAGIYTVTVTDSAGCFFIGSVNILEPNLIDDNEVVTMANCGVCDGSIIMFPSGGTPPYQHSWSNGVITPNNNNLCAGFYTDTITDANNCIGIFTVAVSNPNGPSGVTSTVNNATCYGGCDGSINVITIGGTPSYSYSWTSIPPGGPYQPDSTITGLCAGTYNLTITDASGCILNTSLIVGEADSITANPVYTDATCNGNCDGTASVSPTGGTAPYTYLWSNGSTNSSVSGLCVGLVSVTVTDFNNCTKVVNFNISSPNILIVATSTTATTCNGNCDGTATANPSGGTAPYTYLWDDPLAQTTQTATGLCVGNYNVTVTDSNGCSSSVSVIINEPNPILANEITTPATCGNFDGTAVVAPTGGTGPYTYLWCNGVTTPNVNALPAGTCSLQITDSNNCSQTFLITINNTNGPTVTTTSTNATCNGVCDGTASATVTSGVPNYTYLWTPGGQTTSSVTGLCAGSYTVQVTDGNGCITVEPITITDNTSITATVTTTDATCNGVCDGTALVVPNGGIPPYQYSWVGGTITGQTTNAVAGLCAGVNYTVTITDALGCALIQNVTINEPSILTVAPTGIAANCNGSCDGSATANPVGGTAPYTYLWSTGATTPSILALCAGSYSVNVTDANGCSANGVVNIGDGIAITATVNTTNATCGLCDGSATVTGGGGAGGPYTYLWSPGGQTTTTINNLCPGAYQVDITDNVGCTQTFNVLINNVNGPSITAFADSVSCFGSCDGIAWVIINSGNPTYTFQWDDPLLQTNDTANSLCAGLYNIVVQDGLGCITVDSVSVLEPQQILTTSTITEPSCSGVCDGTATVNPSGGNGSYTIQWGPSAGNQVTPTATGLCAGTYLVTITDGKGCSIVDSVTLTDPTPINIILTTTSPTCNGDCDATGFSVVSGGTPGYTYSWSTTPTQNTPIAISLCSGNYTLIVTDNNGCVDSANVNVLDPLVLSTSSVMTSTSCNGVCDGSITTTPNGGVPPYAYIWSDGQTTQTASNLCAGTYNVIVTDFNNCTAYDTIVVTEPSVLNDSTVVNGPTCGLCDGSATSTPFGGVGPYTFDWSDPITGLNLLLTVSQPSSTIIGLCAGTVNLEITDLGTGCVSNYVIIINNSTGPNVVMSSTDETCISACDGTALASASGGTAPYTFSWNTTPIQTDSNAINLCVGTYTVTVTDSAGCITIDTISINTNGLNLSITNIIPETCFGSCDGSATVVANAGTSPYSYTWSPSGGNNAIAINLCSGIYTATVTDNLNCSDSIGTTITGPTILAVSATENIPISCNGNCDGAAIATVVGGSPNYTYQWNDPLNQTTQIATGLCTGTYIVVVTDNNGCTASDTIIINEPTPILANEVLTSPACNVCDGAITLNPSGGVGPYTFFWTTPTSPPNPNTGLINNLCAGAYSVDITDSSGCVATFNFPLSNTNAPLPNTSVTDVSCFGTCDGSITSAPTGGILPYTYFWTPTGDVTQSINGLCAGTYSVSVTDSMGCIGVATDSVSQPNIIQANIAASNVICNGSCDGWAVVNPIGGTTPFTYNWTPGNLAQDSITNLCAGTYNVTLTDSNGCSIQDSITIIEPAVISVTSTINGVSCSTVCDGDATLTINGGVAPFTFQWNGNTAPAQTNSETGLCFGLNTILITDQTGCSVIDSIYLGATDTVMADAGNDTIICLGSNVDLIGTAAGTFTGVEWFELPGMISLGTSDTINISPTSAGTTCYLYQVNGPCVATDTVCVTTEALPIAYAGPDVTIIEGNSTVLSATGGGTYSWSPGTGLSDSTVANPTASPDSTTTYVVTVTSANGCTSTDSVVVIVVPAINFPNGISPNGDGKNDVWIIDFIEQYPDNVVEIYNRWGELLFHADGYQQDWDGTYNGKELPIGTYYYIIDLKDESVKPYTGPLTILR
jgi:gliding motility-associated-like protein